MQCYFKRFFVLHSSEVIFSFLLKKSGQKAVEIETAFFSFPWESRGSHIGSFPFCFTYPSELPLQTDTYIDELVEIFLKLSMKTVYYYYSQVMNENSAFNYWDGFSLRLLWPELLSNIGVLGLSKA